MRPRGRTFTEPAALHADVMAQLDGLARDKRNPVRQDSAPARFGIRCND